MAAKLLDPVLMVVDEPIYWLADKKRLHLREHFIPCNLTADESLTGRTASVPSYCMDICWPDRLDGVMMIEEYLVIYISEIAEYLDLLNSPSAFVGMVQNEC